MDVKKFLNELVDDPNVVVLGISGSTKKDKLNFTKEELDEVLAFLQTPLNWEDMKAPEQKAYFIVRALTHDLMEALVHEQEEVTLSLLKFYRVLFGVKGSEGFFLKPEDEATLLQSCSQLVESGKVGEMNVRNNDFCEHFSLTDKNVTEVDVNELLRKMFGLK